MEEEAPAVAPSAAASVTGSAAGSASGAKPRESAEPEDSGAGVSTPASTGAAAGQAGAPAGDAEADGAAGAAGAASSSAAAGSDGPPAPTAAMRLSTSGRRTASEDLPELDDIPEEWGGETSENVHRRKSVAGDAAAAASGETSAAASGSTLPQAEDGAGAARKGKATLEISVAGQPAHRRYSSVEEPTKASMGMTDRSRLFRTRSAGDVTSSSKQRAEDHASRPIGRTLQANMRKTAADLINEKLMLERNYSENNVLARAHSMRGDDDPSGDGGAAGGQSPSRSARPFGGSSNRLLGSVPNSPGGDSAASGSGDDLGRFQHSMVHARLRKWQRRAFLQKFEGDHIQIKDKKRRAVLENQVDRALTELPYALKLSVVEEAYPIVLRTVALYMSQLGPKSAVTVQAVRHLRYLAGLLEIKPEY